MTYTSDQFLTTDRVRRTYERCWRDESKAGRATSVTVTAWMLRHTFGVRRIQTERESIIRMLLSLPEGFRADVGGGGSVATATSRGDGTFWTGDMTDVEKLVALGVASGLVSFCAARESWARLPGGLPYIRIEITRFGVSVN